MHAHPPPGAKLEVAEIFQRFAPAYRDTHPLGPDAGRVLADLERCRTPALGHHLYCCPDCGSDVPLYNSCLNRHCPTCQGPAQYAWIDQRRSRLLNTAYFHMVFTLPSQLRPVVLAHRRILFDLLFRSVADTLHAFAADPKRLGAQLGFTLVLHTWRRDMLFHPHIHVIVTGGGLSADARRWIGVPNADFLFPDRALSRLFRGKFLHGFIELCKAGKIDVDQRQSRRLVRQANKQDWNVYAKKPFGGPQQIVDYLGRYTHRVAISSARLISISDDLVVFRTRAKNTCPVTPEEFIRRFLLHVLPPQFFKIRHYGLLAPANVNTRLVRAQQILGPVSAPDAATERATAPPEDDAVTTTVPAVDSPSNPDNGAQRSAPRCPYCGGRLVRLTTARSSHAPRPPPPI